MQCACCHVYNVEYVLLCVLWVVTKINYRIISFLMEFHFVSFNSWILSHITTVTMYNCYIMTGLCMQVLVHLFTADLPVSYTCILSISIAWLLDHDEEIFNIFYQLRTFIIINAVPILCVPLTVYPLDYTTFLLVHKVNSWWLNRNWPKLCQHIEWCVICTTCVEGSHGWKCELCVSLQVVGVLCSIIKSWTW